MDLYADQILEHHKHPRNVGTIDGASATHEEVNVSCGDRVRIDVAVDGAGILSNVAWTGSGCAISQAGMSLLSEYVRGKTADEILALRKNDVLAILGVPVSERRMKCAVLCLHTLQNTLRAYRGVPAKPWAETVADTPEA